MCRRYVHGPGIDEPLVWYEGSTTADKTWLYADHQGSIVGTADDAGASLALYSYGPFGEPNVTTGVRFRYTGQQLLGDLNLYYYKARFYSPALGRFLQTDPIGSVDDLNLYAYVGNNPINFVDPYGLTRAEAQMLMGKIGDGSLGGQNISNAFTGVGGAAQVGAGVAACSTGVGCIAGIPLMVLGVSSIGEAATGLYAPDGRGFNLTAAAIERGFQSLGVDNSSNLSAKTNAVINLTADLAGLNAPSLAKSGFSLFRNIPTDYVRAVDNATNAGLVIQAGSTVNTAINSLESDN